MIVWQVEGLKQDTVLRTPLYEFGWTIKRCQNIPPDMNLFWVTIWLAVRTLDDRLGAVLANENNLTVAISSFFCFFSTNLFFFVSCLWAEKLIFSQTKEWVFSVVKPTFRDYEINSEKRKILNFFWVSSSFKVQFGQFERLRYWRIPA